MGLIDEGKRGRALAGYLRGGLRPGGVVTEGRDSTISTNSWDTCGDPPNVEERGARQPTRFGSGATLTANLQAFGTYGNPCFSAVLRHSQPQRAGRAHGRAGPSKAQRSALGVHTGEQAQAKPNAACWACTRATRPKQSPTRRSAPGRTPHVPDAPPWSPRPGGCGRRQPRASLFLFGRRSAAKDQPRAGQWGRGRREARVCAERSCARIKRERRSTKRNQFLRCGGDWDQRSWGWRNGLQCFI